MNKIFLEKIIPNKDQINELYVQLKNRVFSISHRDLPSMEEHKNFVKNNPYRAWFIVKIQNKILGNIYIQYDNSIGFNFQEEITSKEIEETIELIYSKFKPLKSIPSKRPDYFFINVNSSNLSLQKKLFSLNYLEIQRTYRIPN